MIVLICSGLIVGASERVSSNPSGPSPLIAKREGLKAVKAPQAKPSDTPAKKQGDQLASDPKQAYRVQGADRSSPGVTLVTARDYRGSGLSQAGPIDRKADCKVLNQPAVVQLPAVRYPASARHIEIAWEHGAPLIWHIDRAGADANRAESLRGIPSNSKLDRDEVPMAASREGGSGASVSYIPLSDNRGSGSFIGNALSKFCNGHPYRILIARPG